MCTHQCFGCMLYNLEMRYYNKTERAAIQLRIATAAAEAKFQEAKLAAETSINQARAEDERRSAMYQAYRAWRAERDAAELELQTRIC